MGGQDQRIGERHGCFEAVHAVRRAEAEDSEGDTLRRTPRSEGQGLRQEQELQAAFRGTEREDRREAGDNTGDLRRTSHHLLPQETASGRHD